MSSNVDVKLTFLLFFLFLGDGKILYFHLLIY